MKTRLARFGATIMLLAVSPMQAFAHFLWLVPKGDANSAAVHVYFSEKAEPDDPALLKKVEGARLWSMDFRGKPSQLSLSLENNALVGVAHGTPAGYFLNHEYGVLNKGGNRFLLRYSAKTYATRLAGHWGSANDAEQLPLEITPVRVESSGIVLRVAWKGEALPDAEVSAVVPNAESPVGGRTDREGLWRLESAVAGRYAIRAKHSEDAAGTRGEQAFDSIRHYSTLTFDHTPSTVHAHPSGIADLPQGVTSFGAAVANDTLYAFGGNYGDAHSYSNAGQSGDLWSFDLAHPSAWKQAAIGPKRQGLALVAHAGRIYRIGGFVAENAEGDAERLVSQPDFARLSADATQWEPLPNLPMGRSSHDAAVVGDTVFVVGGWAMNGGGRDAVWHNTLLAYDLKSPNAEWKECARPNFQRRALAAAEWRGKLVVIGGMNQSGGPTTDVEIYDPAENRWSDGPSLHGTPMDGFGCSAFACGDALVVTTVSGSIQSLNADSLAWEYCGQIQHQRFFHRLVPLAGETLAVLGGADMGQGKVLAVERLARAAASSPKTP